MWLLKEIKIKNFHNNRKFQMKIRKMKRKKIRRKIDRLAMERMKDLQ